MKYKKIKILIGVSMAMLLVVGTVYAVWDTGLFELDGNVADGPAAGDDWFNIFYGIDNSNYAEFVYDDGDDGIDDAHEINYLGGGSKDDLDIPNWEWDTSPVPDKNDIMTAGAALYEKDGEKYIYFFLDRFSSGTGDADVGFWFFSDTHALVPSAKDPTKGTFEGVHSIGDILILSEFTIGGDVSEVKVFEWVGDNNGNEDSTTPPTPGTGDGPLQLRYLGVDCDASPSGAQACATINKDEGVVTPPWNYFGKKGITAYDYAGLFEGGVNVSLLNLNIGCGGTFLANTRASQSTDARLHDFAIGDFDLCSIDVVKDGDTLSKVGDDVDYDITVTNTGAITLYKDSIYDSLLGDLTGDAGCGDSLAVGDSCTIEVSRTVLEGDPDPLLNTVQVIYDSDASLVGDEISATDDHSVNLFQPAIDVDKTGDTLSKIGDSVDYTFTLSNDSSADTPAMACTAVDTLFGTIFDDVLPPGDTVINKSRTVLESDPDPLGNTVTLTCSPAGFPNVLEATDDHSVNLFQPAIDVDKTGDSLSKIGDSVDYTFTLSNDSSADTPAMSCTAVDTLFGTIYDDVLPLGDTVINKSRTVLETDPDPLPNTVTLTCSPAGFPNVLETTDDHSVNLFQPAIDVDKTGDTLSKIGDSVDYTFTLSNDSSADTPAMACTAVDTLFGTIYDDVLPLGDTVINKSRTVLESDPDPLGNTVTLTCSPAGFPNVLEATDDHSVNLFQPAIAAAKTGDALSKVGDTVDYTITLSNNSSADTPDMVCTATDSLLGSIFSGVLPLGDTVFTPSRTVLEDDPDPLVNIVTLDCSPDGFPNELQAKASHSTNLFQPAIAAAKTGDTLSKVGDTVDYTITLSNNSSADTPDMVCTATDSLLGSVFSGVLPLGDSVFLWSRTVQEGDPDPLVNTVTMDCSPDGFPNELQAKASHSTNLFQPAIAAAKTGDALSKVGDTVDYTITLSNNSSADTPDMVCTATDSLLGSIFSGVLPLGDTVFTPSRTVQEGDPDPLVNTVTLDCSPDGFPNELQAKASHSTNLFQPAIDVDKTGDPLSKVGDDVDYVITLSNNSSADTPALSCTAVDSLFGTIFDGVLPLGDTVINKSRTVEAGDPDPLINTVSLTCNVSGFPNVLGPINDDHSTNLFQPGVEIIKGGPETAVRGETITYNFTINNTSSSDSPNLILDSVTDTVIGDITADATAGGCGTLLPSGSCYFTVDYTISFTDPSPLVNVVTAHYHPDGFPNDIWDDDDHSLDIPILGCTPGFWQGGAGSQLWNEPADPQWVYGGTNPYIHTMLFNDFFSTVTDPRLDGQTMFEIVSNDGGSANPAEKAARDMVAAYLNESAFPVDYPADSLAQLVADWYAAVASGDVGLQAFHILVGNWNAPATPGYCPLP